ncbi:MAG: hypothetical protein ABL957_02760 [Parvularculaceae bacterium]
MAVTFWSAEEAGGVMKPFYAALAASALAMTSTGPALAHGSLGPAESDLAGMADAADLVVLAEIVSVDYRNVAISGQQHQIPNALVTVKPIRVFRGAAPNGPLVLRFIGGPDGRGGIVGFSGVPMFKAGERNILFIKGNGDKTCPLANCEWGRFRVLGDAVYNTHGTPVLSAKGGRVLARGLPAKELTVYRFPAPGFEAVMQNPFVKERFATMGMSYDEAKKRYETEAPKEIEYSLFNVVEPPTTESDGDPMPPDIAGEIGARIGIPLKKPGKAATKQKKPMSVAAFSAEVARVSAGARRKPGAIVSATTSPGYMLPPVAVAVPPAPKPATKIESEAEGADPLSPVQQQPGKPK